MGNGIFIISSQTPVSFIREKVEDVKENFGFPLDFVWENDFHYSFILSFNSIRKDKEIAVSYVLADSKHNIKPVNSLVYYRKDQKMEAVIYMLAVYNLLKKAKRSILRYEYKTEESDTAQENINKWIENVNKLRNS